MYLRQKGILLFVTCVHQINLKREKEEEEEEKGISGGKLGYF